MIAFGMLYATAVGMPVALAAIICSAGLRRYGRPERGVWLAALGLALALPIVLLTSRAGALSRGTVTSVGAASSPQAFEAISETGILGLPTVLVVSVQPAGFGLDEVLMLAWMLASAVLLIRWVTGVQRLARAGVSWPARTIDGIRVLLTSDVGPAVIGVLAPRILVPSWLLSLPEDQRSLVLLHEDEHISAKDPLLMAVSRVARIVAPWNPVLWFLSSRLLHAVELDCDRRVLERRPDIEAYGSTLLTVSAREPSPRAVGATFAESGIPLRNRIIAMTTPSRAMSGVGISTVLAVGVILVTGSCEVPVPAMLTPEEQADLLDVSRQDIVNITIERDGTVKVNDEPHPLENVSEVVAPLREGSERTLVTWIRGDRDVPYRFVDQLQKELEAVGAVRVMFEIPVSPSGQSAEGDGGSTVTRALGIVAQGQGTPGVRVSQRNILHFVVQPTGYVDASRGDNPEWVQQVWPSDIRAIWRQAVATNADLIAVVKTHPEAPLSLMIDVFNALRSEGAERISLQLLEI